MEGKACSLEQDLTFQNQWVTWGMLEDTVACKNEIKQNLINSVQMKQNKMLKPGLKISKHSLWKSITDSTPVNVWLYNL